MVSMQQISFLSFIFVDVGSCPVSSCFILLILERDGQVQWVKVRFRTRLAECGLLVWRVYSRCCRLFAEYKSIGVFHCVSTNTKLGLLCTEAAVAPSIGGKQRDLWSQVAFYTSLGFIIPGSVVGGYIIGWFLDQHLHTKPVLGIIGG